MKRNFVSALAIAALTFTACNDNGKTETATHDMETMKDTANHAAATDDTEIKVINASFTKVDANAAASVNSLLNHYLHVKTALTTDNGKGASEGAKAMKTVMDKVDKSLFTAEQKTAYDKSEAQLKEQVNFIEANADKIAEQRMHFAVLSQAMYDLVKSFGGGKTIYHEHCPMYNENKGAMWLSDSKDVKNPYYGSEMLTCGTVEEMIK